MTALVIGAGYYGRAISRELSSILSGSKAVSVFDLGWGIPSNQPGHFWLDSWFGSEDMISLKPTWWGNDHTAHSFVSLAHEEGFERVPSRFWDCDKEAWSEEDLRLAIFPPQECDRHEVERVVEEGKAWRVFFDGGKTQLFDVVIFAAGVSNKDLIYRSLGGGYLPDEKTGVVVQKAWLYDDGGDYQSNARFKTSLGSMFQLRDPRDYSTSYVGNAYLDDSDPSGRVAKEAADEIMQKLSPLSWRVIGNREWRTVTGSPYVRELERNLFAVGGGDRFSLLFAGGVAHEVAKGVFQNANVR